MEFRPTPEGVLGTLASALGCTMEEARALMPDCPKRNLRACQDLMEAVVYKEAGAGGLVELGKVQAGNLLRNLEAE